MDELWYKNAVFYAIDVESFQDGNDDGFGDFKGLTSRLDYLEDLGVTCLWLLPFFATPNRDNGYDVKDYYSIDSRVGDLQDFSDFIAAAKERNIRVIIDLIIHHTSNEHPWFQAACNDPTSKFHHYYIWSAEKPEKTPEPSFPGQENNVWTYEKRAGAYYFHHFYNYQPDLNLDHPDVQEEIMSVMEFWLAFKVDGFRVDAATFIMGNNGVKEDEIRNPTGFLRKLRKTVTNKNKEAILLAEADVEPPKIPDFFGKGDRFNSLFNFILDNYIFLGLAREEAQPIAEALKVPMPPKTCQWTNFLRNLDELNLGKLSEEERQDVFKRFAPKEDMRIYNRGIRRRLAPMLNNNRAHLELAYSLLFSLPGSPLVVYGDEIGLGENLALPGRTSVRTAMQWNAGRNGGFSAVAPGKMERPPVLQGPFGIKNVNAESQQQDDHSLFSWMKRLIRMRKHCREIGWSPAKVQNNDNPHVLVYTYEFEGNALLIAHNLSAKPVQFKIKSRRFHARQLVDIFGNRDYEPTAEDKVQIPLDDYGYRWFRVNRLTTGSKNGE